MAAAAGCTRPDGEGERYLAALGDAIRGAVRIVVSEHSFELDAYDTSEGRSLLPEPLAYRTVELSAAQRQAFLAAMTGLDTRTQDALQPASSSRITPSSSTPGTGCRAR